MSWDQLSYHVLEGSKAYGRQPDDEKFEWQHMLKDLANDNIVPNQGTLNKIDLFKLLNQGALNRLLKCSSYLVQLNEFNGSICTKRKRKKKEKEK